MHRITAIGETHKQPWQKVTAISDFPQQSLLQFGSLLLLGNQFLEMAWMIFVRRSAADACGKPSVGKDRAPAIARFS